MPFLATISTKKVPGNILLTITNIDSFELFVTLSYMGLESAWLFLIGWPFFKKDGLAQCKFGIHNGFTPSISHVTFLKVYMIIPFSFVGPTGLLSCCP